MTCRPVRRFVLLIMLTALFAMTTPVGMAGADPNSDTGSNPVSSTSLPANFPADLRKFVGGTAEFRSAEWFTGPCADRGGDMGEYISQMLTHENRLLFWTAPEDDRYTMIVRSIYPLYPLQTQLVPQDVRDAADEMMSNGGEPEENLLPRTFPLGDAEYHPPKGVCADDLKKWTTPSSANTWGFDWATEPDATSLEQMKTGSAPEDAFTDPCSVEIEYCTHAFFADCEKATSGSDATSCQAWNASIGHLFDGTAEWIDANKDFTDRIGDAFDAVAGFVQSMPAWRMGAWVVSALGGIISAVVDVVAFVADPTSIADDWANAIKEGCVEFATSVLRSLVDTQHFDPTSDWFRQLYAVSVALGFVLMAFMTVLTVQRSGTKGSPRQLAESLFGYLPGSVFIAIFTPGFAALILDVSVGLADSMATLAGQPLGELIDKVAGFNNITRDGFPGGSIVAIIMFGLMGLGALSLWLGLMFHDYGLPLSICVAGISYFMMINPKYRHKALRPVFMFLGLAFAVPMLFFLLAIVFTVANLVPGENGMGTVTMVFFVAIGMILAGLGPWGLLKWAPIMPTTGDSEDFGAGQSTLGDTVGGVGNYLAYGRGGGGHGVGGDQPTSRVDSGSSGGGGVSTGGRSSNGGRGAHGDNTSNPLTRSYRERGDGSGHGGGHPAAGAGRGEPTLAGAGRGAVTSGAGGGAAATAGAGAATGGLALAAVVGSSAVSSSINKAKSTADDSTAPQPDDTNQ